MQCLIWWILLAFCLWSAALSQAQDKTTQIVQPASSPEGAPEENKTETTTRRRRAEREEVVSYSSWTLFYKDTLTVDPKKTVSIFTIPVGQLEQRLPARFNITFSIPNPPEGCNPNTTLWYSPAVYYKELCMERDWMGKCTLPSGDGFRNEQDLIDHYGRFKRVLFDYDIYEPTPFEKRYRTAEYIRQRQTIRKTLKGTFCYDDRDYWVAFSTSCANATSVDIIVGLKDNGIVEKWTCRGFNHFMLAQHGRDAFATSRLFWAIIIPIGYFAFLFAVIMGCGHVFQCGAKGRVTKLLKVNLNLDFDDDDDSEEEEEPRRSPRHRKKKH